MSSGRYDGVRRDDYFQGEVSDAPFRLRPARPPSGRAGGTSLTLAGEQDMGSPMILIAALGLLAAVGCIVAACLASTWPRRVGLIVAACVLLIPAGLFTIALFPEVVDARVRAYKRFYADIEPGMTRADVTALVQRHYPADGRRLPPKIQEDSESRLGFFMNPEDSHELNCEGIFLDLKDGRVAGKRYSED